MRKGRKPFTTEGMQDVDFGPGELALQNRQQSSRLLCLKKGSGGIEAKKGGTEEKGDSEEKHEDGDIEEDAEDSARLRLSDLDGLIIYSRISVPACPPGTRHGLLLCSKAGRRCRFLCSKVPRQGRFLCSKSARLPVWLTT